MTRPLPPASRFDIPAAIRNVLDVAIETELVDAAGLFAMACEHGGDWPALLEQVTAIAYAQRMDPEWRPNHRKVCAAVDAAHADLREARQRADRAVAALEAAMAPGDC